MWHARRFSRQVKAGYETEMRADLVTSPIRRARADDLRAAELLVYLFARLTESAIRARRPRPRPFQYVTLRGSMADPPWSHDTGPPSRALTMLSLRAEAGPQRPCSGSVGVARCSWRTTCNTLPPSSENVALVAFGAFQPGQLGIGSCLIGPQRVPGGQGLDLAVRHGASRYALSRQHPLDGT
jgi:hypothetical protein